MFTDYLQTPVEMSPHPLVTGKEKLHVFFGKFTKTSQSSKFTSLLPNGHETGISEKISDKFTNYFRVTTEMSPHPLVTREAKS